jgi:magnesium transporter
MFTGLLLEENSLVEAQFSIDDIIRLQQNHNQNYWIDLVAPIEADLNAIGEILGLSPLAIEDAYTGRQRPKIEHHNSHLFINAYSTRVDEKSGILSTDEIAIFVTPNGLITVRDNKAFDMSIVVERWQNRSDLAAFGVSFFVWGLLDTIVDGYFDALELFEQQVEDLEEMTFASKRFEFHIQELSYELRKALVIFRRTVSPMREVVTPLIRNDNAILNDSLLPYFQDVYDHVLRVTDSTESLRDLVTTLLETNLTIQNNNMNLIMKKVTSWAAIIAVPTAITGFYGQNIPYPGYGETSGFVFSTAAIVGLSALLFAVFRRNDWL